MYIEVGGKLVGEYLPRHGHTYVCTHAQTDTWTDNPIKTIISKFTDFNPPHLPLAPRWGRSRGDLRHQKTRVPGPSCGVVCVILCLAVLVEHRLVTDTERHKHRQTQGHSIRRASIATRGKIFLTEKCGLVRKSTYTAGHNYRAHVKAKAMRAQVTTIASSMFHRSRQYERG